jgi:hypothetical protein
MRSEFVEKLMEGASEEAIAEATARWFRVLKILIRMAEKHDPNCLHCNSPENLERMITMFPGLASSLEENLEVPAQNTAETHDAPPGRTRPFWKI